MKAFILAAGFGTRLKPYTERLPKPLFPVGGTAILDRTISQLAAAGASGIVINTHHLHTMIEDHVRNTDYPVPISLIHEPEILDTGGAIRNAAPMLGDGPLIVVNGDIVTDVDYADVVRFHQGHEYPATLVLHDFNEFNCVTTDTDSFVHGFYLENKPENARADLAFTGIQVIDPGIIERIPPDGPYSSIDLYRGLIKEKPSVKALIVDKLYWADMGTPEKYLDVCRHFKIPAVFGKAFGTASGGPVSATRLCGDGSDRTYTRISSGTQSLVLSDHGITMNKTPSEVHSFVTIGRHLENKGIPVPRIYDADLFSGQVYLEDLGDTHLVHHALSGTPDQRLALYKDALDILVRMSLDGGRGFKSHWTCQTAHYDEALIIERECHYFVNAFINGVLGMNLPVDALDEDFHELARRAVSHGYTGFMHRDFQSRNIMVSGGRCVVIDFQGGRTGPVQYDLASLLIDPYAALDTDLQHHLLEEFMARYDRRAPIDRTEFLENYRHVRITRNLQMLGAFGFLSRVKGKTDFESHIPRAVKTLKQNILSVDDRSFKGLKKIIEKI